MPLDSHREGPAQHLDRLDDTVIAASGHHQPLTQFVDGLMMAAQHLGPISQQALHDGAWLGGHANRGEPARARLVIVRADDVGEMLDEAAAQSDVEHLVATTDGQQRQVTLEGSINKGEFEVVTAIVASPVPRIVDLAIAMGTHIAASDHHQAVKPVQDSGHDRLDGGEMIITGGATDGWRVLR